MPSGSLRDFTHPTASRGTPSGNRTATVGNLVEKIRRRPNGDRLFSARSPQDPSRIIARKSTDDYKGKLADGDPPIPVRSPVRHRRMILWFTRMIARGSADLPPGSLTAV